VKLSPETTYQAVIGRVIVRIRKDLSVEQAELATAVGVNQSTWSRIERGESSMSVEQLIIAAEYLKIKPSAVFWEVEVAIQELKQQGLVIRTLKNTEKKAGNRLAMVGVASLGALVGAAVARSGMNDKKDKQ